jgi:hypothetical protein
MHLSIMVVDPLCLVHTDVSNKLIFLSLLTKWQVAFCIIDNYDTWYLEQQLPIPISNDAWKISIVSW